MKQIQCPKCHRRLDLRQTGSALRLRCPACGAEFVHKSEITTGHQGVRRTASKPPPPRSSRGAAFWVMAWVSGLALLITLVAVTLLVLQQNGSEIESRTPAPVASLGSSERSKDSFQSDEPDDGLDVTTAAPSLPDTPQSAPATTTGALAAAVDALPSKAAQADRLEMSPEQLFAVASPAVVRIFVRDQGGDTVGMGSGFLVSSDGLVVTNFHVVEGSRSAEILLANNAKFAVNAIAALNKEHDLALLKVDGRDLPFLTMTDTKPLEVGATVYALGNPRGLTSTLSDGLISALRKDGEAVVLIQTTAPISPGSSGGPLLGTDGQVVGVTTAYIEEGQNLNFAVPASYVRDLIESRSDPIPYSVALGAIPESETDAKPRSVPEELPPRIMTLHEAAEVGNLGQIRANLFQREIEVNVDSKNRFGYTSLHIAAKKGYHRVAELLLMNGADVNAISNGGTTPLHYASNQPTAKILIAHGAVVDERDEAGLSPLLWAAIFDRPRVVEILLDNGAEVNSRSVSGATALIRAARAGNLQSVQSLLGYGADLTVSDNDGCTALYHSVLYGKGAVVKVLLDNGASLSATTARGETVLHRASTEGKQDIVIILLHGGADVNAKDSIGQTPLHRATSSGAKDCVSALLAGGANVNARDKWEKTPLHNAVLFNKYFVAQVLLEAGADVHARDSQGRTPLASAKGSIAELLRDHGGTE